METTMGRGGGGRVYERQYSRKAFIYNFRHLSPERDASAFNSAMDVLH